jgi:6-pyruvoyltetrahydropterin/6-carboxytetrahydropterin synthase
LTALTASLTRRIVFAAAHRYHRPEWDAARNEAVFGLCARPHYHGHTYVCDVTVVGPINEATGMIVDLARLDRVLADEIQRPLDHRNLNLDVPEFADGREIPTGENLARMQRALGEEADGVRVSEVRVAEDDRLWATVAARP